MTAPERKAAADNNCIKHNLSMRRSVEQKIQQAKKILFRKDRHDNKRPAHSFGVPTDVLC